MKRTLLILLIAVTSQIFSQADNLIANVDGRKTVSLNGDWNVIIDPYESGYYNHRYQPIANGYFINEKPENERSRIEYDFDTSPTLSVPGDWNTQMPELLFYEGTVWYKRNFEYEKNVDNRLFIYFGAVNYEAIVYINGEKVGEHIGGFTPFNFEITDYIQSGNNFVVVKVDNKRKADGVPTLNTDWWNYGGITRRVMLIETPATFIEDHSLQLSKGSLNEIKFSVQLDGPDLQQDVIFEIKEMGLKQELTTDKLGYGEVAISSDPELWSPSDPKLYNYTIKVGNDVINDRVGFRSVSVEEDKILLNGESIFLRGICIHEEAPFRGGRCVDRNDSEILLSWAKELGCNFVRLAHYPHNESMVRLADEIGIMVWSEIPVYWTIQFGNESVFNNASNQLEEMIKRDKNRASVVIWSVANETPRSEERLDFLTRLIEKTRELDPTRLVTAATEIIVGEKIITVDDPLADHLDVIGVNEYFGWYVKKLEEVPDMKWESNYNKPVIMSELGGGAKYGHHGNSTQVWTEEYQEAIYKNQILMLDEIPFLAGMTPWLLMDFRSPRRPLPVIQDYWNRKGLFSEMGEKKKAFYILQNYYNSINN